MITLAIFHPIAAAAIPCALLAIGVTLGFLVAGRIAASSTPPTAAPRQTLGTGDPATG